MKRTGLYSLVALLLSSALVLSGCNLVSGLFGPANQNTTKTLAEQVVDELVANLSAASKSLNSKAAAFTATEINMIKNKALEQIKKDGKENSQYIDEIVASMVAGVGNALQVAGVGNALQSVTPENKSILTPENKSILLKVTAKSSVESLAKPERANNFKTEKKTAVATVAVTITQIVATDMQDDNSEETALAVTIEFASAVIVNFSGSSSGSSEQILSEVTKKVISNDPSVTQTVVQGTISAVIANNSSNAQVLIQAAISGAMDAVQMASDSNDMVTGIVMGTVTALSGTTDTDLVDSAIGTTLAMATNAGLSQDDITTIVSNGPDPGNISDTISSIAQQIASEEAPIITSVMIDCVSDSLILSQAKTVSLSVAVTGGTGSYTYRWIQEAGPEVTITNATTNNASVAISKDGTYTFKVTVTNAGGYKFSSEDCTVVLNSLVQEGITALQNKNFDLAYTKFQSAYAKDNANTDALFWGALLNIAAIGTDPNTVSLFKDRIGMASYPSSMNELFSTTWFNGLYYNHKFGFYPAPENASYYYIRGDFVPDEQSNNYAFVYIETEYGVEYVGGKGTFTPNENGEYYCDSYTEYNESNHTYHYYDVSFTEPEGDYSPLYYLAPDATRYTKGNVLDLTNPILLPKLSVPTWAGNIIKDRYIYGQDSEHISTSQYFELLLLNLIQRNPNGLNSLIDTVLNGLFGSRLTQALNMIEALPDDAAVAIPNELFIAFAGSAPTVSSPIKINKAELKAYAASVQVLKSFVQLIASYNLNYPIGFLQVDWTSADSQNTMLNTLLSQQNPIAYGFMGNRNDSMRGAAKQTLLTALNDANKAASIIISHWNDADYISSMTGGTLTNFGQDADIYKTYVLDVQTLLQKVIGSLNNNATLYINPSALNGGTITELLSATSSDGTIPFNLSVLYSKDVLNPAKLLEVNTSGSTVTGLKLYGFNGSSWEDLNSNTSYSGVAFGVNYDYYKDLFPMVPPNVPSSPKGGSNYLVPFSASSPDSNDTLSWSLLNWIQGKN